jgi:radical SAM protein with 4Fe4S-binding SPASM domain
LTLKELYNIIKQAADLGVFEIYFGGGEPFLRKDFLDILKVASDYNFQVIIITNGTHINEEKAKLLSDLEIDHILFRLDVLDQKLFSQLCYADAYLLRKSLISLDLLLAHDLPVVISSFLTKINKPYLKNLIEFACQKEVLALDIHEVLPLGRAGQHPDVLLTPDDWQDIRKIMEDMKSLINSSKTFVYAQSHFNLKEATFISPEIMKQIHPYLIRFPGCRGGKMEIAIDSVGNVWPCKYVKEYDVFKAGNVREYSLREIWESSTSLKLLRNRRAENIEGKCQKCPWLTICVGGCPAIAFSKFGSIYKPDPRCPLEF